MTSASGWPVGLLDFDATCAPLSASVDVYFNFVRPLLAVPSARFGSTVTVRWLRMQPLGGQR
jgi:hypothetical protein